MATATESALQAKTISPGLTVDNLDKSIKFYEGLGFVVDERWESVGVLRGEGARDAYLDRYRPGRRSGSRAGQGGRHQARRGAAGYRVGRQGVYADRSGRLQARDLPGALNASGGG
jgi:catechol 2,3-dioxygenase-like lactoylglutathione lyase family enzyme